MKRFIKLFVVVAMLALFVSVASAATNVYTGTFDGESNIEDVYTEAGINVGDEFGASCTEEGEGHTHLTITSPSGAEVFDTCCESVNDFTAEEAGTYTFRVWDYYQEGETVDYTLTITRPDVAEEPEEEAAPVPGCDMSMAINSTSVMGQFVGDTQLYWGPDFSKTTGVVMKGGQTAWVLSLDKGGKFYKLAYQCDYLYAPVEAMAPTDSGPWNFNALPH
ncbi:MAG TPA: hypothetical protein VHP83_11710 [Aggregatilineaceae bacterium]|nr:hypothetical protein [Aggregatilineaceae bacterium]